MIIAKHEETALALILEAWLIQRLVISKFPELSLTFSLTMGTLSKAEPTMAQLEVFFSSDKFLFARL